MKRREFITLLGGAAAAWPLAARAQQSAKIPRIGILDDAPMWQAFRQALHELGYVDAYEYRYGEGAPDRLATVAAFAASADVVPAAAITATCLRIRSAASAGSRSL
jgi:hypothetical protein